MLSARGEEYDRIHGFELGIDDYVVKPFSPKELMMRVARHHQAQRRRENQRSRFVIEGLTVDFTARLVIIDERRMETVSQGVRPVVSIWCATAALP